MAYKNLGTFLTRITIKAVKKIDDADASEIMRIAENVNAWAAAGTITEEQVDEIAAAMPQEPVEGPDIETEPNEPSNEEMPDLDTMTKAELIAYAQEQGVTVYESWTKAEIIAALEGAE